MDVPLEKQDVLARLRRQISGCEHARSGAFQADDRRDDADSVVSTGCPALDRLLPRRGLAAGTLVEWLLDAAGGGAWSLSLLAAREASRRGRRLVIVDRERQFYPPALRAWGFSLENVVFLRAADEAEELWAIDQVLRCRAVAAVWAVRPRLTPHDFRRLQLAAEEGGTLGLLVRSARSRGQPTWADIQFFVEPRRAAQGRGMRVNVARCRGGRAGQTIDLELDDVNGRMREVGNHETHRLPASAALAAATTGRRTAGA